MDTLDTSQYLFTQIKDKLKLNIIYSANFFYSSILGKGYLDRSVLGNTHFFTFGVEDGEGVLFLLNVNSCGGVDPILMLLYELML